MHKKGWLVEGLVIRGESKRGVRVGVRVVFDPDLAQSWDS